MHGGGHKPLPRTHRVYTALLGCLVWSLLAVAALAQGIEELPQPAGGASGPQIAAPGSPSGPVDPSFFEQYPDLMPDEAVDPNFMNPHQCWDCQPSFRQHLGGPAQALKDPTCDPGHPCTPRLALTELGLGAELLPFCTFELDAARPRGQIRVRLDSAWGWELPDRTEYFYGQSGGAGLGPPRVDRQVDFIDTRLYMEVGSGKFGFITEVPIRSLNPDVNNNTTGLGDMHIGTKLMILDEGRFQVSQLFNSYFPTGLGLRGLGTQHVSMELGFAANYKLSCTTYLHGQFMYWFPIPANLDYSGTIMKYGAGVSHLLYERPYSDFAVIPTFEIVAYSILDGKATAPNGNAIDVDGQSIINIHPGVHVLVAEGLDVGLMGGWRVTNDHFFSEFMRAEVRMAF